MTQECGAAEAGFGGDAEAWRDMPWDEGTWDHDLLSFYRRLIELRRAEPALQRGQRKTVALEAATETYAYLRTPLDLDVGASTLLTVFNISDQEQQIHVPLTRDLGTPSCLLTTGSEPPMEVARDDYSIALGPKTATILRLADK